jgi:Fe-S-cluster containining protein
MKKKKTIECSECKTQATCCRLGAWVDLEEAKKILGLRIKGGDFFHLEKDDAYFSGYRVGTSVEDESCTFLTKEGLCAIHKIDYNLKPEHCREFPYEKNKLSPIARYLCEVVKSRRKKKGKRGKT